MPTYRPDRVAREIQRILSQPISDIASFHGGGMITVTNVTVSPDLSLAKLYVSVYGNSLGGERIIALLNEKSPEFRSLLAPLHLKVIPTLRFYLDTTLDDMERIEQLLKQKEPGQSSDSNLTEQ